MSRLKKDFGVRALIAVLLIVGVFALVGMMLMHGKEPDKVVITLVATLVATVNSVVLFYYGTRSGQQDPLPLVQDVGTPLIPFTNDTVSPRSNNIALPNVIKPPDEEVSDT